jgi:hypothetical protein
VPAAARRPGRLRAGGLMRAVFIGYLVFIVGGIAYFTAIGLLGQ